MIVEIKAKYECDQCGKRFAVCIDPGTALDGKSILDIADDEVAAGGLDYEAAEDQRDGFGSVGDDGRHYCAGCTEEKDSDRLAEVQRCLDHQATLRANGVG